MGFTKPVAEIAIKTTAINDLVLKIALTTTQSSTIQRHLLEVIARCSNIGSFVVHSPVGHNVK